MELCNGHLTGLFKARNIVDSIMGHSCLGRNNNESKLFLPRKLAVFLSVLSITNLTDIDGKVNPVILNEVRPITALR